MNHRRCMGLAMAPTMLLASAALAQPANDHCPDAIPLANQSVTLWNPLGATRDVTLTCDQFPDEALDVWYKYTTSGPETVSVSICGGPTPYVSLGIFASCGGAQIACDSWSCGGDASQSQVTFQAPQAGTYYICLVGYAGGAEGDGYVAINTPVVVPPPPNDTCATAQVITAPGNYVFDSTGAATDSGPNPCNINARPDTHDVFFRYNAPADGWVRFDTLQQTDGSNTTIAVLDACNGNVLACNDDVDWTGAAFGLHVGSWTCPLHVTAGSSYIVRVATSGANSRGGPGTLRLSSVPGPLVYAVPSDAIAEPGPACDTDYNTDVNYGCNPRVGPTHYRATDIELCQTRKGHIAARSTPISDGTLIHDFDAYHFTLAAPTTIRVVGQAQFIGLVTLLRLPCNASVVYTGQIGQNTNPECGAAEFDLTWSLPAGEYNLGFGTAPANQPTCGQNDEYWFNISSSVPCNPACPADLDDDGDIGNGYNADGGVDINDLLAFLAGFEQGRLEVDLDDDGDPASGNPDGGVDINDLIFFLGRFEAGC